MMTISRSEYRTDVNVAHLASMILLESHHNTTLYYPATVNWSRPKEKFFENSEGKLRNDSPLIRSSRRSWTATTSKFVFEIVK